MIRFELTTSIAKPPAEVFDFLADMRNESRWHTDVKEAVLQGEGPIAKGSTYDVTFNRKGSSGRGTVTYLEFDPPTRTVMEGRVGSMRPVITHTLEAAGEGTVLRRQLEMETSGMMKLMAPMMKRMMVKANTGFLANLKRVLEQT